MVTWNSGYLSTRPCIYMTQYKMSNICSSSTLYSFLTIFLGVLSFCRQGSALSWEKSPSWQHFFDVINFSWLLDLSETYFLFLVYFLANSLESFLLYWKDKDRSFPNRFDKLLHHTVRIDFARLAKSIRTKKKNVFFFSNIW